MSGWRSWAFPAVLVALAAAYWIAWRAPAVGTFHDDGVYIVTAKALAEGKGYRIISHPLEMPQTKYPILLPALLAGVWKISPQFPQNVPWLKLIPLLSTVIWLLLSYRLLREEGVESWMAKWICCLTAASTWVIYVGTMVLSEAPFAALTTGSLLLLRKAERIGSARLLAGAAVCAGLAFHTRTLGIALMAAAPLYLAARRRWREAALFAVLAGAIAAPWIWWVVSQPHTAAVADAYYSRENYQGWNILTNFTFPQKIEILLSNFALVLFTPGILAGIPPKGALALPALAVGVASLMGLWKQRFSLQAVLLVVYGTIVCAWAWLPSRFVVPFLPLLLWFAVDALAGRARMRRWAMAAVTAASIGSLSYGLLETLRLGYPTPPMPVAKGDEWGRLEALLRKTQETTQPEAVLAGNLDPLYYLYTGRKAVRGFAAEPYRLFYSREAPADPLGSPDRFVKGLQSVGVTHWLDSPNSTFAEGAPLRRLLEGAKQSYPGWLEPVGGQAESHVLYKLRVEPQAIASRRRKP
jgi:hypothetical protein